MEHRLESLKARGVKGTTGTQASFLELFGGDHGKVERLEEIVARKMGFADVYPVTGQTYSRKVDSQVVGGLSGIAQSAHKAATDLRLLARARNWKSRSKQSKSAPPRWPTSATPCGANAFAAWRGL